MTVWCNNSIFLQVGITAVGLPIPSQFVRASVYVGVTDCAFAALHALLWIAKSFSFAPHQCP